jgi:WD40 repeat protein
LKPSLTWLQDQQSDASSLFTDLLWLTRKSWDALAAHALQVYLAPFLILSGVLHDRIKKHKPLFAPIFKTWRLEGQWRTQPQIFTTNGRALSLLAVVVSHDRERIIALSAQQTLTLWDIHGGRLADVKLVDSVRLPEIGQCPRQRIVITFDDLRVIVTLLGINILAYDAKSLREVANWTCPAMVKDIALIPGTKMMLTTSNDGVIRQWNHETGRLTAGFKHPAEHITCSPDGRTLASIDISGKAMRRLQHVSLPKPGSEEGHALCFSSDGSYLASAHGGGVVHLWSVPDRELVLTFSCVPCLPVSDLQFSSDGRYLLLVTRDQEAVIWDSTESRSMATTVQWPNTSLTDAKLIDQDVGGVAIVTTTTDGFVRLVQNTHLDQLIRVQPTIFSSPEVKARADRSIAVADAQHFTHIEDVRTQEAFVVPMTNGSNRDERPLKAFMLDETRVLQISSVGDGQKDAALARVTNWRTGKDYLKWEMDVAWNWSCAAVTSDGAYLAITCLSAHPVGKKVRRGTSKRHASTVSPELPGWDNEIPHQVIEIYRIKTGGVISTIDLPSRMDSIPISQLEFSVDGSILSAYNERQLSPTPTLEPTLACSWQAGKDYLNLGVVYEGYKPSSLQFSGYNDGWLGVRDPLAPEVDLRLCWIPTELRWMQVSDLCRWKPNSASPVILPSHGAIVAITSANGVVTVVDFTEQLQDVFPPVIATGLVG